MQKTTLLSQASRFFSAVAAASVVLFLAGCSMVITNLTPETIPANPSQIYTITANIKPTSQIEANSLKPRIVIDGKSYPMTRNSVSPDVWEFEYQLPPGRSDASYYFICNYAVKSNPEPQEMFSDLQRLSVAGRYVLRPEASRAPVGSRVSILGAGFTAADVAYFDQTPTRTVFESPSSLSFFVPTVEAGQTYRLTLRGNGQTLDVGTFRVDGISFQVSPAAVVLRAGEQQALTFTIPQPAPAGGMLIDVTTDVPQSIIMPEVMVPANATSVTVPVQGGKPGNGSLFFRSSAGESTVPVTVTGT